MQLRDIQKIKEKQPISFQTPQTQEQTGFAVSEITKQIEEAVISIETGTGIPNKEINPPNKEINPRLKPTRGRRKPRGKKKKPRKRGKEAFSRRLATIDRVIEELI